MSIRYDLFKNPPRPGETGKRPMHARVVCSGTIGTKQLAELIAQTSTFSTADVKGVLQAISDRMADALLDGYHVSLDGIGNFSLSLECRPVMEKNEIRASSVSVRDINFRSSNELKKKMHRATLERSANGSNRDAFDEEERKERIVSYIRTQGSISRRYAMLLNQCSTYKAKEDLDSLAAEHKIMSLKCGKMLLYTIATEEI